MEAFAEKRPPNIVFILMDDMGNGDRASKGRLYEGGIREPLIIRWLGHMKPGRWHEDDSSELYDVVNDVSETKNVAADHADVVAGLRVSLEAFLKESGATYATPNPKYDPSKKDGRS